MHYAILMCNVLTLGSYTVPTRIEGRTRERLLVERQHDNGGILTITEAGLCPKEGAAPDSNLEFGNTLVGTLIRRDTEHGIEDFLFNRVLPDDVLTPLQGTFFPADGAVRMSRTTRGYALHAVGRHLHKVGSDGVVRHAQEPFDDTASGRSWLFEATHIPWAGEVLDP